MMSRIMYTKIWKDEFFAELTPTEKLLFIYFITNERVNIIHCYEVTDREIAFDTGINRDTILKCKDKFQSMGRIAFFNNYVFLVNAHKYETYKGERNEVAKAKLFSLMDENTLDWFNNIKDRGISTPLKGTINHKSEIINHKSEKEGIVKGRLELPQEKLEKIAEKYQVPISFVLSKQDDVNNWVEEKPTRARGRDLQKTLVVWVKKDAMEIQRKGVVKVAVMPQNL